MSGKIHDFPKTNSACQAEENDLYNRENLRSRGYRALAAAAKNCVIVRMAIIKPS